MNPLQTLPISGDQVAHGVMQLMEAPWVLAVLLLVLGIGLLGYLLDTFTVVAIRIIRAMSGLRPIPDRDDEDYDDDDDDDGW